MGTQFVFSILLETKTSQQQHVRNFESHNRASSSQWSAVLCQYLLNTHNEYLWPLNTEFELLLKLKFEST